MCCGYLAGWGAMFDSITFRWTYMTWPFFAAMTTTSVLLTLFAFILGIMCRINFGRGLPYYCAWSTSVTRALSLMLCTTVKTHESVEEGFEAVDQVVFPSSKESTYTVPFGSGIQFPPLSQVSAQNAAQPTQMNS